jgi:hypothetical protein
MAALDKRKLNLAAQIIAFRKKEINNSCMEASEGFLLV